MLDDCKGDKLFEVLASFSTAVLKRTLAAQSKRKQKSSTSIIYKRATASSLTISEQASLLPLAIAHRALLARLLEDKEAANRRYRGFSDLLDSKASDIARKLEDNASIAAQTGDSRRKSTDEFAIRKLVKENWLGSSEWVDVLIHGSEGQTKDGILDRPFSEALSDINSERSIDTNLTNAGLLQQLEARIRVQQGRLQQWEHYHKQINAKNNDAAVAPKVRDIKQDEFSPMFTAHEQYRISQKTPISASSTITAGREHPSIRLYNGILQDLQQRLSQAAYSSSRNIQFKEKRNATNNIHRPPRIHNRDQSSGGHSYIHTHNGMADKHNVLPANAGTAQSVDRSPDELVALPNENLQIQSNIPTNIMYSSDVPDPPGIDQGSSGSGRVASLADEYPIPRLMSAPAPTHSSQIDYIETSDAPQDSQLDEETAADKIISSVAEASPSPVKKRYRSLTERTRMSIATYFEAPDLTIAEPSPELPPSPGSAHDEISNIDRRMTLSERARLSMSAVPERPKPTKRKSMTKKMRESLYPVNQFEVPDRIDQDMIREEEREDEQGDGQRTPKEALFSDDAEYESIFKSRPKVAHSPLASPALGFEGNAHGTPPAEADISDLWDISSPLTNKYSRRLRQASGTSRHI